MTVAGGSQGATDHVRDCVSIIEGGDGTVEFIELICSDAVLRERISHPDRHGGTKMVDPELLDEFKRGGYFMGLPDHPAVSVDTTHRTPSESAHHILTLLEPTDYL